MVKKSISKMAVLAKNGLQIVGFLTEVNFNRMIASNHAYICCFVANSVNTYSSSNYNI